MLKGIGKQPISIHKYTNVTPRIKPCMDIVPTYIAGAKIINYSSMLQKSLHKYV